MLTPAAPTPPALLNAKGVCVDFRIRGGILRAVDGVDLTLTAGESIAIVGESGCGKSALASALLGLLPGNGAVSAGSIHFAGQELAGAAERAWRPLRGRRIAMVFQDPMTSLTPWLRIGAQISEQIRVHQPISAAAAQGQVLALLAAVGLPDPRQLSRRYPHELSGGQRQRVVIAMALSCNPELLIADEPTTALDVTVQAQVLALIRREQRQRGMGLILITHNLAVARGMCERMLVMYAGRVVEDGPVADIFNAPQHPYTRGLLAALPRLDQPRDQVLQAIPGTPPRRIAAQPGCPFAPRCPLAEARCVASDPPLQTRTAMHSYTCIHAPAGLA